MTHPLTQGAQTEHDNFIKRISLLILNEAESNVIKDHRSEISEIDINKGKKKILEVNTNTRKWAIRIVLVLMLFFQGFQLNVIRVMDNTLSNFLPLLIPNLFGFIFLLLISYCFKEDWL
jgi:hypothetical protein